MKHPTQRFPGDRQAATGRPSGEPDTAAVTSMRARRIQLKQTQEEVAAAINVSLSSYQRWERAAQIPHLRSQRRIADHLDVPYAVLNRWFGQSTP
jgi:transcriptional regulator with XRE-family HTH domain